MSAPAMKRQIPIAVIIAPALLILAAVGYFLLVKPKQADASKIQGEITNLQTQIEVARAAQRQPEQEDPSAIKIADLFKVTQAMPDDDDMPGIILELNKVAAASGVSFLSIAPQGGSVRSGYSAMPINLTFEGNYYDLTDFLFRLRNLVRVRDGELAADGRLFTLDSLAMEEGGTGFPSITASLTLTAFVYSTTPPAAATAPAAPASTDTTSTGATDTTATTTAPTTTTPPPGGEITP
jgi:Tfp pilus assembly protein PilO